MDIDEFDIKLNELGRKLNHLMNSAANACHAINPDNPQAVADNLVEMFKVLELVEDGIAIDFPPLNDVLSKIQAK